MTRIFFLFFIALSLAGCGPKASGPAPLRVGMELSTPPFEMADSSGKPDGVSVRLAEALAQKLGRPLQLEVIAFKGLETALKTGKIDVILSSMTDTPKRRESIAFTDAYCRIGLALLVPKDSPITDAAEHKADAFIYDQLSILKLQASQPDTTRALLRPLQSEAWAMALTQENTALREQINSFLREFRASGGFERLATQYLSEEKAALSAQGVPFIFE